MKKLMMAVTAYHTAVGRRVAVAMMCACAAVGANGAERPDCFVDWIGATRSGGQFINTEYVFKTLARVEAYARRTDGTDCDQAGTPSAFFNINYSGGGLYYRYASGSSNYTVEPGKSINIALNTWVEYVWGTNIVYDGVQVAHANNWNTADFSKNTQVFYLFAGRTQGAIDFGRVRMYDGETLVRDYYPARKDGVYGLYDMKFDKFYGNGGKNAFLHGDVIVHADRTRIEAIPVELGSPDPGYGFVDGLGAGEARTLRAPEGEVAREGEVYACIGWDAYRWNAETGEFDAEPYASGTGTVCDYVHPDPVCETKIVWKFAKNAVSVTTAGPGHVESAPDGEFFALTAVPDAGAKFLFWRGNVPEDEVTNAEIRVSATAEGAYAAWFRRADGSSAGTKTWSADGGQWEDPAKWDPAGVPEPDDDVVISAGCVDAKEVIGARSLTVAAGATFRFAAAGEPGTASMAWPDASPNRAIYVFGDVTVRGNAVICGRAEVPGTDVFVNELSVRIDGDLSLLGSAQMSVAAASPLGPISYSTLYSNATVVAVGGDITVGDTATLRPVCDHLTGAAVKFTCANFSLAEGASVNGDDRGWQNFKKTAGGNERDPQSDDNRGIFTYARLGSGLDHNIGAGYGGAGSAATASWGAAYGYAYAPFLPGAPGGGEGGYSTSYSQRAGQIRGGGVFWLWAAETAQVDGRVSMNALNTSFTAASGGGIWIAAGDTVTFGEKAALEAKGADAGGGSPHCAGGGGRISVAEKLSDAELEELALGGLPATHVYVDWISAVTTSVLGGTCTGGRAGEGTASYVYNAAGKTLVHVVPSNGILVTGCDPVYGDWPLDSGAPATFTAPEHGFHPDNETWRYPCLGFAVSNLTEEVTNGTARTLVYLVGDEDVTVYWKWGAREFGHPIAKTPHGVVEADGVRFDAPGTAWPREGEKLTLRAVPDAGAEFLYWQGDVPWGSVTNATLVLEPSEQRVVWAVFRPASAATTVTWLGGEGDWNDPAQWDVGNVPGRDDDVVIAAGTCRVDQCGLAGSLALSGDALLTATPTAMTTYRKNAMLAVTRNLAMTGRAGICFGRTNSVADVFNTVGHDLAVGGDLTLRNASVLTISGGRRTDSAQYQTGTATLAVGGKFEVRDTAKFRPNSDGYAGGSVQVTVGGRFTLSASACVDADRFGYGIGNSGSGSGYGDQGRRAASHGGYGTTTEHPETAPYVLYGAPYDYKYAPREPGQTSRHAARGLVRGGGAIRIVAESMKIDGRLTADGGVIDGVPPDSGAGGASSGGTIWLAANHGISMGAGVSLSARGASSAINPSVGASGGGRIAICERLTDAQYAALLAKPGTLPAGVTDDSEAYLADHAAFADAVAPGDAVRDMAACWGTFAHLTGTAKIPMGFMLLLK